ncbi:hypothetical protein ACTG1M_07840 [Aeromonas sp. 107A]
MALEFGSGTQADPYLLVNLADVTAWLTTKPSQGYWFALISDLDVSGSNITSAQSTWAWNIDGRGYKLHFKYTSSNNTLFGVLNNCTIKNIDLEISSNAGFSSDRGPSGRIIFNDAVFRFNKVFSGVYEIFSGSNGLLIDPGTFGVKSGSLNIFKSGKTVANTTNVDSFADGNPYNKANYPSFSEDKWIFDGVSLPRPRQNATADLTNRYGVKGQTKVGGNNRQRKMAVFTENGLRYKVQDTKADGSFFLNLNDVSTPVIVMAYDDIGAKAAINTAYSLNQIIHPATPNGFRYRCTLAGNSGATIPPEPWPTSAVLTIGAAKFTPEPVYEPKAHGPLLPVLFNVVTEQPV